MGGHASRFFTDMKTRIITWTLALTLLLSSVLFGGCNQTGQGKLEKFSAYSFDYFDTVTTVSGYAESKEAFDAVANDVLRELEEYHRLFTIYHRFEGLENLCTVNELADGQHRTVTVDERIIDLLLYAKQMHELTDGKINIAMGSVLSIWHDYRTEGTGDPASAMLPPMEKLQEAGIEAAVIGKLTEGGKYMLVNGMRLPLEQPGSDALYEAKL